MSDSTKKGNVVRAEFTDILPSGFGNNSTSIFLRGVTDKKTPTQQEDNQENAIQTPMMESTPSGISSAMVKLYPYLIVANYTLGVLTWSNENIWSSVLVVAGYIILVSQLSFITKFLGHIVIVAMLLGYTKLNQFIERTIYDHATIEDIVKIMNQVAYKFDLLFLPLTNLDVNNIERLLLVMLVLSPIVIIINLLIIPPKRCLTILGVFLLTYHSPAAKVTRRLLWKFKTVRKLIYYTTGLNLGGIDIDNNNEKKNDTLIANVQKQVNKKLSISTDSELTQNSSLKTLADDNKPIKFTYVLYENQRHWIGMGWKSSMLNYERTSWTDEFLNEAPSPDKFQLPPMDNVSGMKWRWLDKTWRLDLTNDGAIDIGNNKLKTTADPTPDQGYIYYDNSWKRPSTEESFSKYTRRRRWIRTAELVQVDLNEENVTETKENEEEDNNNNKPTLSSNRSSSRGNSKIISNSNAYDSIEMKINSNNGSRTTSNDNNDFMAHDNTNLSQLKRNG